MKQLPYALKYEASRLNKKNFDGVMIDLNFMRLLPFNNKIDDTYGSFIIDDNPFESVYCLKLNGQETSEFCTLYYDIDGFRKIKKLSKINELKPKFIHYLPTDYYNNLRFFELNSGLKITKLDKVYELMRELPLCFDRTKKNKIKSQLLKFLTNEELVKYYEKPEELVELPWTKIEKIAKITETINLEF